MLRTERAPPNHIDLRAAISSRCLSIDARSPEDIFHFHMFGRPMSYGDISWTKKTGWNLSPIPENGTISPIGDTDYPT